jgi:hypothetical protein
MCAWVRTLMIRWRGGRKGVLGGRKGRKESGVCVAFPRRYTYTTFPIFFSLGQEFLFRWIALAMAFKSCVGSFSQLGMHGLYPFGACKEGWHVRCKMYECKEGRC